MDERRLERSLAIHEAAYRLLKWLGTAIDRGFVAVVTAHRPFCASLVEAPRLKTSQVVGADRRRADDRKRATLDRLARVGGDPLPAEDVIALLKDDAIRRDLATVAYAEQLLERCEGRPGDRSALALWRQFAWQGHAPKRGYRLTAGAIRESERRVAEAVRAAIRS